MVSFAGILTGTLLTIESRLEIGIPNPTGKVGLVYLKLWT